MHFSKEGWGQSVNLGTMHPTLTVQPSAGMGAAQLPLALSPMPGRAKGERCPLERADEHVPVPIVTTHVIFGTAKLTRPCWPEEP